MAPSACTKGQLCKIEAEDRWGGQVNHVKAIVEPQISPPAFLRVRTRPAIELSDDEFFEFCQLNRDLRIERTAEGDLIVMSPSGSESSYRNLEICVQLRAWAKKNGTGVAFEASAGFTLPDGSMLAPDASWVRRSRLAGLTREQKRKFLPLCPDFVVELRSPSDRLSDLQEKMQQYLRNGAQLGWLLDPESRTVYVYRPDQPVEDLVGPSQLAGDPELPGFVLELAQIWEPDL
jgi:Uma2 family endonuclease